MLALGAVLIWGVDYEVAGLNVDFVGAILIIFGAIGLLSAIVSHALARLDRSERSRRQAGTSL